MFNIFLSLNNDKLASTMLDAPLRLQFDARLKTGGDHFLCSSTICHCSFWFKCLIFLPFFSIKKNSCEHEALNHSKTMAFV